MGTTYLTDGDDLTSVADAIRAKGGTSGQLQFPSGFVDAVEAIETGGGLDLLASVVATESVLAFKIDYDQSMDGYDLFLMEVEGTASSNQMFLCPQVNTTDKNSYYGNGQSFHRFYWVVPVYNSVAYPPTVQSHVVCIGPTIYTSAGSNAPNITFFYVKSIYNTVTFNAGTSMKIWGLKL